ncbi:MAG: hypothetical protein Q8S33_14305 [Myxococcales bacterium]|nr:hypothetical protein [Myxococcales bacterium]
MRVLPAVVAALACVACSQNAPEGPAGPKGDQGTPGATGPAGERGPQGERGLSGEIGPQGPQGSSGANGTNGTNGMNGAPGPAGPQGLQGPAGMVLVLDGGVVTGPAGASVIVTPIAVGTAPCTTGGVRITQLSDGGTTSLCNGAVGPIGLQGVAGPQGPRGPAGASISASLLNSLSPQCPTGGALVSLADGGTLPVCNGAQGPQGQVGPAGPMGSQGVAGPVGAVGPMGNIGPAGPAGPAGSVGPAGPAGGVGPQGPAGVAGAAGPAGAVGPSGPPGVPGAALYLDGGLAFPNDTPSFAGFTSLAYTGAFGGVIGANQKCAAEFPGASFCTIADFDRSNPLVPPGPAGAWIDSDRATSGARSRSSCGYWSVGTNADNGTNLTSLGVFTGQVSCNNVKPLACCRAPTNSVFRGFTAGVTTGSLGGVIGANQRCNAEFPGASFCTIADFDRANPVVTPSASGAWIDSDRAVSGARSRSSCGNWSVGTNADNGTNLTALGVFTGQVSCNNLKPIACCQAR